jgi:molybdenum cofactor synthesis domain-containing protein
MSQEPPFETASDKNAPSCMVITIGEEDGDKSGQVLRQLLAREGYNVAYRTMGDEPGRVKNLLDTVSSDAVIFNGGTGLLKRRTVYDGVEEQLERVVPAFETLFYTMCLQAFGASALQLQALLGVYKGKVVMLLPAAPKVAQLTLEKLILPELKRLIYDAQRGWSFASSMRR